MGLERAGIRRAENSYDQCFSLSLKLAGLLLGFLSPEFRCLAFLNYHIPYLNATLFSNPLLNPLFAHNLSFK